MAPEWVTLDGQSITVTRWRDEGTGVVHSRYERKWKTPTLTAEQFAIMSRLAVIAAD